MNAAKGLEDCLIVRLHNHVWYVALKKLTLASEHGSIV
jgi:hypothetical protein